MVGFFVERLTCLDGGVHILEELFPAVGVIGSREARPGAAGILVEQGIFLAPGGDKVAGVAFKVVLVFFRRSYGSRVANPAAHEESTLGSQDGIGIIEDAGHRLFNLAQGLEVAFAIGFHIVGIEVAEVVAQQLAGDVDCVEMARAGVAVGCQQVVKGIQQDDVVVPVGRGDVILAVFVDVAHRGSLVDADGLSG